MSTTTPPASATATAAAGSSVPKNAAAAAEWPTSKIKRVIDSGCASRMFLAVLVLTGRLNPVHQGHLELIGLARRRLEALGYAVLAAWLSPAHDQHVEQNSISAALRVKLAQLSVYNDPAVDVATWESDRSQPGEKHKPKDVVENIHEVLCKQFPQLREWLHVFQVVGGDEAKDAEATLEVKRSCGVVVIPREGAPEPVERQRALFYVADKGRCFAIHGSDVRTALARGDLGVFARLVAPRVASFVATQQFGTWEEWGAELSKLGIPKPAGFGFRETPLPPPTSKAQLVAKATTAAAAQKAIVPKPAAQPALQPQGPPCISCNSKSHPGAKFCAQCGARLPEPPPPVQPPPPPPPPPPVPGAVAASAGFTAPKSADLKVLQVLDRVVTALQKQGLGLERVFRRIDIDRSGTLQRDEFCGAMQTFTGLDVSRDDLDALWTAADADGDGNVTLEEFMSFLGKLPAHIEEARKVQDKDVSAEKHGGAVAAKDSEAARQMRTAKPVVASAVLKLHALLSQRASALPSANRDAWDLQHVARGGTPTSHCLLTRDESLVIAVAALSPWDGLKPAATRTVHSVDIERVVREDMSLVMSADDTRAFLFLLGLDAGKVDSLLAPSLKLRLDELHDVAAQPRQGAQSTQAEAPEVTKATRLEAALREVSRLRAMPRGSDAGAVLDLRLFGVDLTSHVFSTELGETVLMLAAGEGWLDLCRHLCATLALREGHPGGLSRYIDAQHAESGWSALFYAVHRLRVDTALYLLDVKATPNMSATFSRATPLMLAAHAGCAQLCRAVVDRRADVTLKDCNSHTARDYAVRQFNASAGEASLGFSSCIQVIDSISLKVQAKPVVAEKTSRRRRRRVDYLSGEGIGIQWRLGESEASEVLVWDLLATDRAYVAGVRLGWELLAIDHQPIAAMPSWSIPKALECVQPPVTLEFGRPLSIPDDIWTAQVDIMVQKNR